jgi:hypothetical protein
MARPAIAFTENDQISAGNPSMCRQNSSSPARFPRLQPRTTPRINDPAESRLNQQIHENHQIDHNHQICHGICVTWERRAVRFLPLVLARQNEEISEELRQRCSPHSLSSACSEGLQLGGVVAAPQVKERANMSVISPLRLVQGLHLLLPVQVARKEAALPARPPRKSDGRKTASGRARTSEFERKPTMTCRIDRVVIGTGLLILHISGQITGKDVDLLRSLLEQERSVVAVDLKDVLLVDRGAVRLLAISELNGAELRNCPAYIREWVRRERVVLNASEQGIEASEASDY